ncbi:MAG: Uma2 family endonuclease [Marinilabiliaceae bacterium]|nr:Uma2 family endonuclease [Marinilabiliaceae bacterium]
MEALVLDLNKRYSYADYLTWLDDVRRELIDGFIKMMAGASRFHGKVGVNIIGEIRAYLRNNRCGCEVYSAPIDVLLPKNGETEDGKIYDVVQPDIFVVCGGWKGGENAFLGAPDMIVEILSPSNRKRDIFEKFYLYQKAGVREYWIADPKLKAIAVYIMQENGEYDDGEVYKTDEKIPVHIFNGYMIKASDIFDY